MRARFSLVEGTSGFVLRLSPVQRDVLTTAIQVVRDLKVDDKVIDVQFGAPRAELAAMASRLGDIGRADEIQLTVSEARVVYGLLRALPDCFSSDEAFHVRTGFFKENFVDLARGFLTSISELSPKPDDEK